MRTCPCVHVCLPVIFADKLQTCRKAKYFFPPMDKLGAMTDSTTKEEILDRLVLGMSACVSIMVRWWVYSLYEKVKDSKDERDGSK